MKRNPIPSHILKLDGGNASAIAKRVGRTASTIKRWMRDGIPPAARAECKAALARHQRAIQAAATHKASTVRRKAPAVSQKPRRAVSRQPLAVSQKVPKRSSSKLKAQGSRPIIIPMTSRERAQMETQRQLFREHIRWLKGMIELEKRRQKNPTLRTKHGKRKEDKFFLEDMVEENTDLWIAFINEADRLGLTIHDARQSFFSPKLL